MIRRKHTANAKRELPGLLIEIIEPLMLHRERQARTIDRYQQTLLADQVADHAILSMFRENIIGIHRVPDVMKEWEEPSFAGFEERNAWRLFNAVTFVLTGRIAERPDLTRRLHHVIDGVCETVH